MTPEERASPDFARNVVESFLPDTDSRTEILRYFAETIQSAHTLLPSGWSITLKAPKPTKNDSRTTLCSGVTLNVGSCTVLAITSSCIELTLAKNLRPSSIDESLGIRWGEFPGGVKNYGRWIVPASVFLAAPHACTQIVSNHKELVKTVAQKPRGGRDPCEHSDGVLGYLDRQSKELHCPQHEELPRPADRGSSAAKNHRSNLPKKGESQRLAMIAEQLRKIEASGTNGTVESASRKEQGILRDLLIGNADKAACAICGETFAVSALVAAHKKPRRMCDERERTDPNIVMPACLLGCDFLFERGYIFIEQGVVKARANLGESDPLQKYISRVAERKLAEKWTQDSDIYFLHHKNTHFPEKADSEPVVAAKGDTS